MREAEFRVECHVGRLIEARLVWLNDEADVKAMQAKMLEVFAIAGPKAIICADWRQALVFPPKVGEALVELLRQGNRRFERSAVLLSPNDAIFGLQLERLFREANNPNRRSFRASEPLLAWLAQVLSPAELGRATSLFL